MDKILDWFGADEYQRRLDRIRAFWAGAGRCIVSINSSAAYYRQAFDDGKILALAPENLRAQAALPGCNLPCFFPDFGTISTAKYWGGKPRFDSTGGNIFLDPVAEGAEAATAITPSPVDHESMDAAHGLTLFAKLCRRLHTQSLWLRSPDFQGPLNTAGLVVNQENLLVEMYTSPDAVREFLKRVTDFLIRYARHLSSQSGGRLAGNIWPYTFLPCDTGISFTEDLMPLLSPELYRQFGIPCLEALSREFGGLHIHCCGDWGRHAPALAQSSAKILAMEFHYPFTKIEELACLAPTTVFIPYISLDKQREYASASEYYEHLLATTDERHRFWFAWPGDGGEAVAFARKHGF